MIERKELFLILGLHWVVFGLILMLVFMFTELRVLNKEVEFRQYFEDSITRESLQNIMCNGNPV